MTHEIHVFLFRIVLACWRVLRLRRAALSHPRLNAISRPFIDEVKPKMKMRMWIATPTHVQTHCHPHYAGVSAALCGPEQSLKWFRKSLKFISCFFLRLFLLLLHSLLSLFSLLIFLLLLFWPRRSLLLFRLRFLVYGICIENRRWVTRGWTYQDGGDSLRRNENRTMWNEYEQRYNEEQKRRRIRRESPKRRPPPRILWIEIGERPRQRRTHALTQNKQTEKSKKEKYL